MKLFNQTKKTEVANVVLEANTFLSRLIGLLGHAKLDDKCAMYFPKCNNIHTAFMRFAIDVVFVDKNLQVKAVSENVTPFKLKYSLSADSLFEMNAGAARAANVEVGDQLNVVD